MRGTCGFCFHTLRQERCNLADKGCWYHFSHYEKGLQDEARAMVDRRFPSASGESRDLLLSEACRDIEEKRLVRSRAGGYRY